MARHRLERCWLRNRRSAIAVATLCSLEAVSSLAGRCASLVSGAVGGSLAGYAPSVRRHAEAPKLEEEPDIGGEVGKILANTLGINDERTITAADRVTPIDRWFGWDKAIIAARDESDPFVDSSDVASYVTLSLERPFGIEFVENAQEEGSGVMIGEVLPGSCASASGLQGGYHLIVADNTPVYGLPFDEAIKPIVDSSQGPVKLTFFKGDAVYFYGEFRPSTAWLTDFIESLRDREVPPQGAAFEAQ